MTDLVLRDTVEQIAILTLNRPERHNSLVPVFLEELLARLTAVAVDPGIRAVVLQANGRSFSTGGDALGFVEHERRLEEYARVIVGLLNKVIIALIEMPVPVITAVQGIVTGGAIGLVIASDIVLVAPEASFTPYYSVVGPSPDGGWAVLLPHIIGHQRTAEALFTNKTITSEEAIAWGLANRLVAIDAIRAEALQVAGRICEMKPGSIRHSKQLLGLNRIQAATLLDQELEHFVKHISTEEAIGGFRYFLESLRAGRSG